METQARVAPRLSNTLEVETPELVVLSYTIAGVGSRAYAAIVDYIICFVAAIVAVIGVLVFISKTGIFSRATSSAWIVAMMVIVQFAIQWGYYVLFEALYDGRTPGHLMPRPGTSTSGN